MSELTKEEKKQFIEDWLEKYIASHFKQLADKSMTIDDVIKAMRYEIRDRLNSVKAYKFGLVAMHKLFKSLVDNAEIQEKAKKLNINHEEIWHKLSAELMTLIENNKWVGVFHSQEHYEAFKHVLKSFLVEEHNKTLFMGFYREYGGKKVLMRCNERKWREWVNEHYLIKGEDSSKRWNECPKNHYTRMQIRQRQKTYKDPTIFKEPAAR